MTELSDLPEDVIAKICLLLPAKVVLRLKSVQKSWNKLVNALAKTPSFVANHLHNSKSNRFTSSSFIIYLGTNELYHSSLDMKHTLLTLNHDGEVKFSDNLSRNKVDAILLRHNTLFAHCDGVVCTVNLLTGAVKLWNPATGDLKLLPGPFFGNPIAGLYTRIRNIGFGYDAVSSAYKVVELISRAGSITAKVYQLGNDTSSSSGWREGVIFTSLPVYSVHSEAGVCCEGVCYWLALFEFSHNDRRQMVLCFDLHAEKFDAVSLPSGLRLVPGLARWKESIFFFREPDLGGLALEVWVMSTTATAENRWTKSFLIAIDNNCTVYRAPKPVGFWKNGDELLIDLNLKGFCNVISYNVVENKYTCICCEASDESRLLYYLDSFVAL